MFLPNRRFLLTCELMERSPPVILPIPLHWDIHKSICSESRSQSEGPPLLSQSGTTSHVDCICSESICSESICSESICSESICSESRSQSEGPVHIIYSTYILFLLFVRVPYLHEFACPAYRFGRIAIIQSFSS